MTAHQHCVTTEDMHAQLRQPRLLSHALQQQMLQIGFLGYSSNGGGDIGLIG